MDRSLPPTFRLRERSPRECPLHPDDVEFLLARHRAHIEVTPTRRRHRYVLTPTGHVGTIVAPHCRLLIRPKLALPNLLELLDAGDEVPLTDDSTTAAAGTDLLDFLAGRLARLLDERAASGLHRAYREEARQGPFLQGRLDVPAQVVDPVRVVHPTVGTDDVVERRAVLRDVHPRRPVVAMEPEQELGQRGGDDRPSHRGDGRPRRDHGPRAERQ